MKASSEATHILTDAEWGFKGYKEAHREKMVQALQTLEESGVDSRKVVTRAQQDENLVGGLADFPRILGKVLKIVRRNCGVDLRYTPAEFIAVNRKYAHTLEQIIFDTEAHQESDTGLSRKDLEVTVPQRNDLKSSIDSIVETDTFRVAMLRILEAAHKNRASWSYRIARLRKLDDPAKSIRATDTCAHQCDYIYEHFRDNDIQLLRVGGYATGSIPHEILIALPNNMRVLQALYRFDQFAQQVLTPDFNFQGFISRNALESPQAPAYSSMTIVDPTVMQFMSESFHNNSLVRGKLKLDELLPLLQRLSPGNITDEGVFVGTALEYLKLLCLFGTDHPCFHISVEEYQSAVRKFGAN